MRLETNCSRMVGSLLVIRLAGCSSALDMAVSAVEGDGVTEADILKCQAVCLTNRAAAQKMLNRLPQAIQDCRSAIARDSGHVKAYVRATKYHLQRVETDQAHECLSGLNRDLLNADDAAEIKSIEAEMRDIRTNVGKLEEVPLSGVRPPRIPPFLLTLEFDPFVGRFAESV